MEITSSISFFSSYRPAVPLEIYSSSNKPSPKELQVPMTDGKFYNYKGRAIPKDSLKIILKYTKVTITLVTNENDVDTGLLTGLIFGSERSGGMETLHIALRLGKTGTPEFQVFSFSEAFGTFDGVRLEDTGSFYDKYLVYVSTMERPSSDKRRQPWTAVYRTDLTNGETVRLSPIGEADLSPSVSPSGKKIAVASFQEKRDSNGKIVGWDGEIEDLQIDIWVMDLENPKDRKLIIKDGGWPTWGSEERIFFHRKFPKPPQTGYWGVYKADFTNGIVSNISRVTPDNFDAMTPAAIDATTVAVATIRDNSGGLNTVERTPDQYRQIEIFDISNGNSTPITKTLDSKESHFNPFVLDDGKRIAYTTTNKNFREIVENLPTQILDKVESPFEEVGLYRTQGVFPTISKDGSKLAFVDNEFKNVWLVQGETSPRIILATDTRDSVFGPVWDPVKDTLYVCMGPSFMPNKPLRIVAIDNVTIDEKRTTRRLTIDGNVKGLLGLEANNGFPSPNPDGTKLVFRSTRGGLDYKNLYIMEDTMKGEYDGGIVTRLTNKMCTDTHPNWSPNGDWISFASNRDKDPNSKPLDFGLDSGYFAVYLLNLEKPDVVIRIMHSRDDIAGHVNHPFFSPDGNSIVITSDVAAVCVEPISLPLFEHSVRPYGDIFTIDIDTENIENNQDLKEYTRITHSRYENSTPIWVLHDDGETFKDLLRHKLWLGHAKCPCPPISFLVDKEAEEEEQKEEL